MTHQQNHAKISRQEKKAAHMSRQRKNIIAFRNRRSDGRGALHFTCRRQSSIKTTTYIMRAAPLYAHARPRNPQQLGCVTFCPFWMQVIAGRSQPKTAESSVNRKNAKNRPQMIEPRIERKTSWAPAASCSWKNTDPSATVSRKKHLSIEAPTMSMRV